MVPDHPEQMLVVPMRPSTGAQGLMHRVTIAVVALAPGVLLAFEEQPANVCLRCRTVILRSDLSAPNGKT